MHAVNVTEVESLLNSMSLTAYQVEQIKKVAADMTIASKIAMTLCPGGGYNPDLALEVYDRLVARTQSR